MHLDEESKDNWTATRKTVRVKYHLYAQNPHLYLYPEMLEGLLKYVFIPKKLAAAYREHLAGVEANPDARL